MILKNMKIKTLILAAALAAPSLAGAQSLFPEWQARIMDNNPSLRAQEAVADAQMADNQAGLNLGNPEVSLSYMFGRPSGVPNRTNIEVTQPFDFATLSGAKRRVADADDKVAYATCMASIGDLALEIENALIEYVYQSTLVQELTLQNDDIQRMLQVAHKSLEQGKITQLEYNKLELEGLSTGNALALAQPDLEAARQELVRLNGGEPLEGLPTAWPDVTVPDSFEDWVNGAALVSPELMALSADLKRAEEEVNLRKKEGLPDFSVGYTCELVQGANYYGAALGFSLPLWGNHGRVKAAKAQYAAAQIQLETATDQFRIRKQNEYRRLMVLQSTCQQYEKAYCQVRQQGEEYLDKAVKAGTIGMLEYMTEREDYFEHALARLTILRDFHQARALLYAPTLTAPLLFRRPTRP